jgi:hypothetical protein
MRRIPSAEVAIFLSFAVVACGNAETPLPAGDVQRHGQWEVTTTIVAISGPNFQDGALAPLVGQGNVEPQCFAGQNPEVGQATLGGRCTFTQVKDAGPRVHWIATCSRRGGVVDSIETTGTRSLDAYEYRIVARTVETATGRSRGVVETLEKGRRIGSCPPA